MIPFASQRGGGQDLATHLMNAHDNEHVTLFAVRGAVARDLHGALAEWKAIAGALTRCRQYLCSLSINPDERQCRLTRDQYLDYIARAEAALGLAGQPRAIIFHVKQGGDGVLREHCHVVWSRIDVETRRAVPLSFFKEKLMAVTREFARDHGLALPTGYDRQEAEQRRNRQLSPYDCIKQKETGISHEERMAAVSDAWRRSDSGRAFVSALADLGYILAQGRNGTRVVLVDFYGHTTALTRLIDDPAVRAKHVREFLGPDYAPGKLPTVEQAQAIAAQRRKLIEAFELARVANEQVPALPELQAARRAQVEGEAAALRQRQHEERMQLAAVQKASRLNLKSAYLAQQKHVRLDCAQRKPTGLAAFLGRVTGIALITRKVQRYRDRKRYGAYLGLRATLRQGQQDERDTLTRGHELQAANMRRRLRALNQIENRERQTLETAALQARRQAINARHVHMPSLAPALTGLGGKSAPKSRTPLARQFARAAGQPVQEGEVRLTQAFGRVSSGSEHDSGEGGGAEASTPAEDVKIRRRRERRRRRKALIAAFTSAADGGHDEGESGDGRSDDPKPAADPEVPERRRRRKRRVRMRRERQRAALLNAFSDAVGGGEDDSGEGSSADAPTPATEENIHRRKRRQRRRDLDSEFNSASGAGDGRDDNGDSDGGPRRRKRTHGPDPPDDSVPPRRTRKRSLDRRR